MHDIEILDIKLLVKEQMLPKFSFILQNGFMIRIEIGCTIYEFLTKQCYLEPEYIASRISTVFLNGNPVDDIKIATLSQNYVLSLSGAMPGLVGAVMRSGSYYASFRNTISYKESVADYHSGSGLIKLKLFNILMSEIGPFFLERGILVNSSDLVYFFNLYQNDFWDNCDEVIVNQQPVSADFFNNDNLDFANKEVFLTIDLTK